MDRHLMVPKKGHRIGVRVLLAAALLIAGCAKGPPPESTLLKKVTEYLPDGKAIELSGKDRSAFQRIVSMWTPRQPKVDEIFAIEANMPAGEGEEGAYIVVFRSGNQAELRYHEQLNHQPRTNRYYRRALSPAEIAELSAFVKEHPLDELKPHIHPITVVNKTEIGGSGAGSGGARSAATQPEPEPGDEILFRWTHADKKFARSVQIDNPTEADHPAIELTRMMARFRDAAPLTCVYVQPVPTTARILYGSPFHEVREVWANGEDVRAEIYPPLEPPPPPTTNAATEPASATEPAGEAATQETSVEASHWYALRDGQWMPSPPPPPPPLPAPPASEPATPAASAPSTEPIAPTQPATSTAPATTRRVLVIENPRMLAETERWVAMPANNFTMIRHYVPRGSFSVWIRAFTVPGVVFDTEHMWVDKSTRKMYLIHEGTLFALDLPPSVFPD